MTLAPKILVADDDQALSRTLSWILKENGYEVLTVPGGEHLFDHLSAEQFDLLLLDIMMPKVDGLQLLQRVKSDPRFKDLPVLMISSMPPEEATVRSLGLGASDFIPKPFRVRELLARVKAHLRAGRELNQARAEARSRSEMMEIMQEVTASLKPEVSTTANFTPRAAHCSSTSMAASAGTTTTATSGTSGSASTFWKQGQPRNSLRVVLTRWTRPA